MRLSKITLACELVTIGMFFVAATSAFDGGKIITLLMRLARNGDESVLGSS